TKLGELFTELTSFSQQRQNVMMFSPAEVKDRFEEKVMQDIQAKVSAMPNSKLLDIYRKMVSSDNLEFRLSLVNQNTNPKAQSLLQDLNSFEGMINMEIIER